MRGMVGQISLLLVCLFVSRVPYLQVVAKGLGRLGDERLHQLARPAPVREEVHEDGLRLAEELVELLLPLDQWDPRTADSPRRSAVVVLVARQHCTARGQHEALRRRRHRGEQGGEEQEQGWRGSGAGHASRVCVLSLFRAPEPEVEGGHRAVFLITFWISRDDRFYGFVSPTA